VKIIWTEDFGNGQELAPALLSIEAPKEDAGEGIVDEPKPEPKETVKGFGLGK
jgi:hypothetical protein